ncbi:hypothetical protein BJ508DRAFT_60196 [Ascobolus immersus RN42]|uniref:Uncharacterized protein n=1 Tax=Ascobolus immersus RN42 TaxID=1160509 RepID=A0A3N4J0L9_ASCIM|nr:hypothetical protein BJ508DRAFT_60196 [Ascobolus immersus RN42]
MLPPSMTCARKWSLGKRALHQSTFRCSLWRPPRPVLEVRISAVRLSLPCLMLCSCQLSPALQASASTVSSYAWSPFRMAAFPLWQAWSCRMKEHRRTKRYTASEWDESKEH